MKTVTWLFGGLSRVNDSLLALLKLPITKCSLIFRFLALCILTVFLLPEQSQGADFTPTELEYAAWSTNCKAAHGASNAGKMQGYGGVRMVDEQTSQLMWKIGYWHYCWGEARIKRGETSIDSKEREANFQRGIKGAKYSYAFIDKAHPWAAHIGTTIARGYKGLGENTKAREVLDEVLANQPDDPGAHVMYGLIFYSEGDYTNAAKYLEQADRLANGTSGEIKYFIGLAKIKQSKVEEAKKYAEQARQLGYPLNGLRNMIAREMQTGQ